MKATIRTFIAVEIDEGLRTAAAQVVEELRTAGAEIGWVAPRNMHLTLKFLGDVAEDRVPAVCDAVANALIEVGPFELELRGVGAFPNAARPRTLWIGTGSGRSALQALASRVEAATVALGFPSEDRPFQGHLTLGRVRRPSRALANLTPMLQQRADLSLGQTRIDEVVVFSSQLQRGGPIYEAIRRLSLVKQASSAWEQITTRGLPEGHHPS